MLDKKIKYRIEQYEKFFNDWEALKKKGEHSYDTLEILAIKYDLPDTDDIDFSFYAIEVYEKIYNELKDLVREDTYIFLKL